MIEKPDSALVSSVHPSPNIEPRRLASGPSILLLHYTGLPTVERAIEVLSRSDCKVSCHYVIAEDGRIVQMVAESMRAWHAGVSCWAGEVDINSASIGIEIHNAGHDAGLPEFPAVQMRAVRDLSRDIVRRHGIRAERVLAHSDVAPGRKIDPGERFDWSWLAAEGIGHWVEPVPLAENMGFGAALGGEPVARCQDLLARYGYLVPRHGSFDEQTVKVVAAFQRHFRPERVDGTIDRSTLLTLERLIAALGEPLVA